MTVRCVFPLSRRSSSLLSSEPPGAAGWDAQHCSTTSALGRAQLAFLTVQLRRRWLRHSGEVRAEQEGKRKDRHREAAVGCEVRVTPERKIAEGSELQKVTSHLLY